MPYDDAVRSERIKSEGTAGSLRIGDREDLSCRESWHSERAARTKD